MNKTAGLTAELHYGTSGDTLAHPRRCRVQVVRVSGVLRCHRKNAGKRKCDVQRRSASRQRRRSNPTTIRVEADLSGWAALAGYFGAECDRGILRDFAGTYRKAG